MVRVLFSMQCNLESLVITVKLNDCMFKCCLEDIRETFQFTGFMNNLQVRVIMHFVISFIAFLCATLCLLSAYPRMLGTGCGKKLL